MGVSLKGTGCPVSAVLGMGRFAMLGFSDSSVPERDQSTLEAAQDIYTCYMSSHVSLYSKQARS